MLKINDKNNMGTKFVLLFLAKFRYIKNFKKQRI